VRAFAEMMTGRHGDSLDAWMARVDADDLPYLRSFTIGIRRHYAAVLSGLTRSLARLCLPESSSVQVIPEGAGLVTEQSACPASVFCGPGYVRAC
jgi:hypothetical protein